MLEARPRAARPRAPSCATASAESGVCSAGFSTIVQPAASAGAALRVGIAAGKFHGVMPAVTPTGSFVTTMRRSAGRSGSCRRRRASPPRRTTRGTTRRTRSRRATRRAACPARCVSSRASSLLVLEHQVGPAPQDPRALLGEQRRATRAAPPRPRSSARRVSAAPMRGTSAIVSPVAGIVDRERLARVGLELEQRQVGDRRHAGS